MSNSLDFSLYNGISSLSGWIPTNKILRNEMAVRVAHWTPNIFTRIFLHPCCIEVSHHTFNSTKIITAHKSHNKWRSVHFFPELYTTSAFLSIWIFTVQRKSLIYMLKLCNSKKFTELLMLFPISHMCFFTCGCIYLDVFQLKYFSNKISKLTLFLGGLLSPKTMRIAHKFTMLIPT